MGGECLEMSTSHPEARDERLSRLAWSLAAVWLVCWVVTISLLIANRSAIHSYADADLIDAVLPIGFAVIGTLVASRQPRNPIGWILLSLGLLGVISGVITQYVYRSAHFTALPFADWVAWLHDPLNWVVFPAGLAAFLFRWLYVAPTASGTTVEDGTQAPAQVTDSVSQNGHVSALRGPRSGCACNGAGSAAYNVSALDDSDDRLPTNDIGLLRMRDLRGTEGKGGNDQRSA